MIQLVLLVRLDALSATQSKFALNATQPKTIFLTKTKHAHYAKQTAKSAIQVADAVCATTDSTF